MGSTAAFAALLLAVSFAVSFGEMAQPNCTENKDGRNLACYTCMGRDDENCELGITCCKGSCYKLIDTSHNLILKGCTSKDEEDASMKVRELESTLYWANNERIKGESYFCKGSDFCNSSTSLSVWPLCSAFFAFFYYRLLQ